MPGTKPAGHARCGSEMSGLAARSEYKARSNSESIVMRGCHLHRGVRRVPTTVDEAATSPRFRAVGDQ